MSVSEELDKAILESAIDKVASKFERVHPDWRRNDDHTVMLKITCGELRVLKQFHQKHYSSWPSGE